jgi:hypothetical protein
MLLLFRRPLAARNIYFHGTHRSLKPMHAPIHGEVEPNEGKYEHAAENDGGVVHPLSVRVFRRWEEEDDRHGRHPADRNERAESALADPN